jgi:hypothetical protein
MGQAIRQHDLEGLIWDMDEVLAEITDEADRSEQAA